MRQMCGPVLMVRCQSDCVFVWGHARHGEAFVLVLRVGATAPLVADAAQLAAVLCLQSRLVAFLVGYWHPSCTSPTLSPVTLTLKVPICCFCRSLQSLDYATACCGQDTWLWRGGGRGKPCSFLGTSLRHVVGGGYTRELVADGRFREGA